MQTQTQEKLNFLSSCVFVCIHLFSLFLCLCLCVWCEHTSSVPQRYPPEEGFSSLCVAFAYSVFKCRCMLAIYRLIQSFECLACPLFCTLSVWVILPIVCVAVHLDDIAEKDSGI